MAGEKILLVISDPQLGKLLKEGTLQPVGFQTVVVSDVNTGEAIANASQYDAVILEEHTPDGEAINQAARFLRLNPTLAVIIISFVDQDDEYIRNLMQVGVCDFLKLPLNPSAVLTSVRLGLDRRKRLHNWMKGQTQRHTDTLRRRVDGLKELEKIGRSVTASLDLDHVLTVIVEAAVNLTDAEEGSLLILDDHSGELVMRASRNFQDEFVRTFRLPVNDTLAGNVVRSGEPVLIQEDTPQKIKTTYLVRTLMYVPLQAHGKVIGVLGVDNREKSGQFTDQHLSLVSTLADYAAIAIENARLYSESEVERQKLETILTHIEDGVIVVDAENQIILVNRIAREIFGLPNEDLISKPVSAVLHQESILQVFETNQSEDILRSEIDLENGMILNAQRVNIPGVGSAVTLQDITYFKELDRIKSDFVNTVSHDLRSPLTAILGYIELIARVGDVNDKQKEFIKRVVISVRNITDLINNLLDLGRIEAGFDSRKELVPLEMIVQYATESFQTRLDDQNLQLNVGISPELPRVFGDPVRLRQVVDNLLNNAVHYTPPQGQIRILLRSERNQVILQMEDSGLGIPLADQPYIFDKFYRASNAPDDRSGSGLGLAIVKSIVENHRGRVWVDSSPGNGSCFTVVLPLPGEDLVTPKRVPPPGG
jgi:two-component system, OmpR family, phosphate regulon sensor histidine kinase PhoR